MLPREELLTVGMEERLEREFAIYSYQNIEDLIAFLKQQEIEILLIAEELSERVAKWEDSHTGAVEHTAGTQARHGR